MSKKDKARKETKENKTEQAQKEGELLDTVQRLQAEFENYKKRNENEQVRVRELAAAGVMQELLPILDNFSIALKSHENKEDEFYKGIEIIYAQVLEILKEHGVEKIDCAGKFDPRLHEAMLTRESDKENNTILEILQEGYMMKDKVLRHAKVSVSKAKQ